MKKEITQYFCDTCGGEKKEGEISNLKIQVIFTTEQTEGRPIKPRLSMEELDLCNKCNERLLEGNYIFARGAMGHNTYYFKAKGDA